LEVLAGSGCPHESALVLVSAAESYHRVSAGIDPAMRSAQPFSCARKGVDKHRAFSGLEREWRCPGGAQAGGRSDRCRPCVLASRCL